MPCVCEQCVEHAKTLGLAQTRPLQRRDPQGLSRLPPSDGILIASNTMPVQRLEAEEHFKLIQVAYRELSEHFETPQSCRSKTFL